MNPFQECNDCLAKKWCKIYSGEVDKGYKSWCSAKFRLEAALKLSNIPKAYMNANIYNTSQEGMGKESLAVLDEYVEDILDVVKSGTNFFFFGESPGTGKTHLAMVLLNQFIYKSCVTSMFDFENPLGLFVVHADLMDDLRYRRAEDYVQSNLEMVMTAPLLVLDDVGSGTSSPFTRDQTYQIINNRVNNGLSTIYTSNLSLASLGHHEVLGARTVSRITQNCIWTLVNGVDRRIASARRVIK